MDIQDTFFWENEVRDSELDIQGIVNNANYFVYMEHARHKHMKLLGIDFEALHMRGFDLILVHTEISFKSSLRGGDEFIVTSKVEPMGRIRFIFIQEVLRKSDKKTVVEAKNICTCIANSSGRPIIPEELKIIFFP